ncbi:MAG TPA: hypothetical protein VHL09_14895, partial [Dehalococcoidia bacterium]|nr:hypothetical protein [Dehalococcoidia bacterium]
ITQTVEAVAQTARRYPDSDLVQSLASDFERSQADAAAGAMGGSADVSADPGRFRADVLEKCRSARAFLAVKAGEPEGRAYRNWILAVARSVAMASKEGGFLGIGGRPVSPEESAALQELAEVLGLEPDEATGEIRPERSR